MFTDSELDELLLEAQSAKQQNLLSEGDLCWFANSEFDEEDQTGQSRPFFVGEILQIDSEQAQVKVRTDKFPCNEKKTYMRKKNERGDYVHSMKLEILHEYSEPAEEGIRDMMDMNELNHATLLRNI